MQYTDTIQIIYNITSIIFNVVSATVIVYHLRFDFNHRKKTKPAQIVIPEIQISPHLRRRSNGFINPYEESRTARPVTKHSDISE
jgi:hypothetical protein